MSEQQISPPGTETAETMTEAQKAMAQSDKVMKPYDVGTARIESAWNKLVQKIEPAAPCVRCQTPINAGIHGVCFACFSKANQQAPAVLAARAKDVAQEAFAASPVEVAPVRGDQNMPPPAGQPLRVAEQGKPIGCNFCGRDAAALEKAGATAIAGHGALICNACASVTAGCIGARDGAEARAMMAHSSLQAEAVAQTIAALKKVGDAIANGNTKGADSYVDIATKLATIARGGR